MVSEWIIKKLLNVLFKIFHESPSCRADYEKICTASEEDYRLCFCSHRWVENQYVSSRVRTVWPKIVEIVEYWKSLLKSKQPGNRQIRKT